MKAIKPMLFLIVGATLIFAGCVTAGNWEYRTLTTDNRKGKSVLDNYGKSGWELVNYTCIPKGASGTNFEYQYIFKRPKN